MFNTYSGDYTSQMLTDMQQHGLGPQSMNFLCFDAELHRYRVSGDKPGTKNGWYTAFHNSNGVVCSVYGSWKTDSRYVWCSSNRSELSIEANAELSQQINDAKKIAAKKKLEEQLLAAEQALKLWISLSPADPSHRYLHLKRVPAFIARQDGDDLVLPIIDCDNKLWSLQHISPTGRKMLFAGGAKRGHFIPVHGCLTNDDIAIAEGFSTAATIAKAYPNKCVIAAVDAGNLEAVALAIRGHKPYAEITMISDDDRLVPGNPGATKARVAACSSGAQVAMPQWPIDAPHTLTDFNDLACWLEDNTMEMENDE